MTYPPGGFDHRPMPMFEYAEAMDEIREAKKFDAWMAEIDAIIGAKFGIGYDDLPDVDYTGMFEDGFTPKRAANAAIRNAGWGL